MSRQKQIVLAFDAYGTLLSTESIATALSTHLGQDKAKTVAAQWRRYQLEYTWRANSMRIYENFSILTRRSLRHALAEAGASFTDDQIEETMLAYDGLDAFPDVEPLIKALDSTMTAVVFSNGTQEMVSRSLAASPLLSPSSAPSPLSSVVSVDSLRQFKPSPETYTHLAEAVGKDPKSVDAMSEIFLISGNPFDVVGGRAVGMNAIWVDRAGTGWIDGMQEGEKGRPTAIVRGLGEVVGIVKDKTR